MHDDSIWELIYNSHSNILASSSSDDSLKLSRVSSNQSSLAEFHKITMKPYTPTSICFCSDSEIACGTTSSPNIFLFDLEHPTKPQEFPFTSSEPNSQPNKLLEHRQTHQLISAHEDRYLRLFDRKSKNANIKNIVAHSDAVTGVSVKSEGEF